MRTGGTNNRRRSIHMNEAHLFFYAAQLHKDAFFFLFFLHRKAVLSFIRLREHGGVSPATSHAKFRASR